MITRRGFLGLIPGLGLAKGWAGGVEAIPTRKFGRHEEQVSVVGGGAHSLFIGLGRGGHEDCPYGGGSGDSVF
ncbi:MAG: hypothetical protein ACEQSM_04485 [Aliarcobacter sp.]